MNLSIFLYEKFVWVKGEVVLSLCSFLFRVFRELVIWGSSVDLSLRIWLFSFCRVWMVWSEKRGFFLGFWGFFGGKVLFMASRIMSCRFVTLLSNLVFVFV